MMTTSSKMTTTTDPGPPDTPLDLELTLRRQTPRQLREQVLRQARTIELQHEQLQSWESDKVNAVLAKFLSFVRAVVAYRQAQRIWHVCRDTAAARKRDSLERSVDRRIAHLLGGLLKDVAEEPNHAER